MVSAFHSFSSSNQASTWVYFSISWLSLLRNILCIRIWTPSTKVSSVCLLCNRAIWIETPNFLAVWRQSDDGFSATLQITLTRIRKSLTNHQANGETGQTMNMRWWEKTVFGPCLPTWAYFMCLCMVSCWNSFHGRVIFNICACRRRLLRCTLWSNSFDQIPLPWTCIRARWIERRFFRTNEIRFCRKHTHKPVQSSGGVNHLKCFYATIKIIPICIRYVSDVRHFFALLLDVIRFASVLCVCVSFFYYCTLSRSAWR